MPAKRLCLSVGIAPAVFRFVVIVWKRINNEPMWICPDCGRIRMF
jgi:hypothetical protein